ncbi:MAG: S-layer homology domain-containing protein [Clostridia bacterium]|nr:S-layer homology domain-containing protein [Clostridia bacterium]
MSKRLIKATSLVVSLVLIISLTTGFAIAQNTPFRDISANHWAVKDIVKLNIRNVVAGYNDGTFKATRPVTQIEALLMAVRNMGVDDQLALINTNQLLPVSIPTWAEQNYKREVIYAINKGLLIPTENNFKATEQASRAWVAQLIVRMINKNSEAALAASQTPALTDASSIPTWALGYVNTALKYKLISGYPDNTFKPNQTITRAELAALLSRSEQYLNLSGAVATAKIVRISGQSLSYTINGIQKNVTLTTTTWVFDAQGKLTTANQLKENDMVKIIEIGSLIKYIELLPADTVSTTIKGTVLQVLPKDKVIVVKDDAQKIHTKTLSPNTSITAQSGDVKELSQIEAGNQVELGLNLRGDLVSILLLNTRETLSNTGIIHDLNQTQKLLILKSSSGKLNAYQYSDQVVVKITNQRFPGIKDLQVGDEVKIKVEAGLITEIELVKANQQLTIAGKVMILSPEKRILTIQKNDNTLEAFPIADSVTIKITGLTNPVLADILVNDKVEITVEQGKIASITVNDRTVEKATKGTVAAVDVTNRILTIKTDKDELKAYEVNSRAEFVIDDRTSSSLSDVKKDMKVELQLADNKIIFLETKNTTIGTVTTVDQTRRLLTLKINNTDSKTYVVSGNVDIDIEGDSSPELNDINRNDLVEIRLEDNVITKLNLQKTYSYQVTNLYKSYKELKIKDKDGNSKYLVLGNRVELVVPGVTSPTFDDFATEDIVRATFLGHKLIKVELIPVIRGQVTSVNSLAGTVTLQSFAGNSTTYTFTNKSEVINNNQTYSNLNSLVNGDRVEIKEKEDGSFTIKVMKKVTGKYQAVTDDSKKLHISKNPVSWESYNLATKAYVHKGTQQLTLGNLFKDEQVTLYILDDTVYEIEKQ